MVRFPWKGQPSSLPQTTRLHDFSQEISGANLSEIRNANLSEIYQKRQFIPGMIFVKILHNRSFWRSNFTHKNV